MTMQSFIEFGPLGFGLVELRPMGLMEVSEFWSSEGSERIHYILSLIPYF